MFVPNSDANAAAFDAVFGAYRTGETTYAPQLLGCLAPGMLLLADRNFAVTTLVEQIHSTEAQLLIRCKDTRVLPPITHLPDQTWLARMGTVTVRVTDEKRYPAHELVRLYHHRWEIETSYLELKSTILGGRVPRAATPAGVG